jgi:hypothetical protein
VISGHVSHTPSSRRKEVTAVFANPGPGPARMIFLVSPSGHEHYQKELAELFASAGPLDAAIAELRARHDIDQLTSVIPGRP